MKKLNKEHLENNSFQELRVFENNDINKAVDSIYQLLYENFGSISEGIVVCGSVAKLLHGYFKSDYKVKDVDLLIINPFFYRFLKNNVKKLGIDNRIDEHKIILFYPFICIELWENNLAEDKNKRIVGTFKNQIKYSIYVD